ncbi:MAG: twin-arginine translocation signal domain-containing protein [Muribaculaceae bacterium]|nr:twin-arginine translocation signal domain-containing protein [Muribaculaceae bacterium]
MKDNISRRSFIKRLGLGVSATGLTLVGCDTANKKAVDATGSRTMLKHQSLLALHFSCATQVKFTATFVALST